MEKPDDLIKKIRPKSFDGFEDGRPLLSEENKIHISEAMTFVSFDVIVKLMKNCKIGWEGTYSDKNFYLNKSDFINNCIK